jgi:TFIIF-interacting CTD phosphatase-like protein
MFFKKSMVNIEGKLLKNLRIAETDITKVLALDVSAENFIHKENCILVSPYAQHNKKDTELKELITFLKERVNLEDETLDFRKITKEYKNAPDKAE